MPVGVLKAGKIRFTPELPATTRAGLDGLEMGVLSKIGLRFDGERFGIAPNTDIFDSLGPRATFDFECWAFDRDLIVTYFGGDHAREVLKDGPKAATEILLKSLESILGPQVRRHFLASSVRGWMDDPFSLGAYSHALPGQAEARGLLAQPVGDRLWFAGEAAGGAPSYGGAMTAGGAYLAGIAAADAIIGRVKG